ncbi:MAG TPA: VOC family protein [Abditibacterium sp.]|jgi:glyoxylase I family protein
MTNQKIPGCGFHHIAIWTANWDASLKFYCDGLGFSPKIEWGDAPQRAAMLDTGDGNYLEVFERETAPESSGEANILHLCFRTDDCEAALKTALEAGAKLKMDVTEPGVFENIGLKAKIAFFYGPDGEIVELFECAQL